MPLDFQGILNAIKNFGVAILTSLGFSGGKLDFQTFLTNMIGLAVGFLILTLLLKKLPSLL